MNETINQFINSSHSIGLNTAYIQGAGGNSSMKNGSTLIIKSSGILMKEIRHDFGLSYCEYKKITTFLSKNKRFSHENAETYAREVNFSVIKQSSSGLPSMETGMHAVIPSRYIFHLHSVYGNILLCMKEGKEILTKLFSKESILFMDFLNPGYELAFALNKIDQIPPLILLQNHGIVIHGDSIPYCKTVLTSTHQTLKDYLKKQRVYKRFMVKNKSFPVTKHFFPDSVVFSSVSVDSLSDRQKLAYQEIMSATYFIEEMITQLGGTPIYIPEKEVKRIVNLSQEKYRLKLFYAKDNS